ncbi:MBL fold metallo-hydrolase [Spirochaeta isovalerica]|uniref:Glyoxylase-like metal-dependent hydrolase (Beta-lactamase superfamily II) n=1 Tax=Spirochaeta isovalerica TaxID=150 RepID=A0A841R1U7_9SPIO|nr:MBL fold metallo-hydrolase [Spirochaeta isovalerica]MBB6478984.1 glyoxylase-like metal-dependent hydrolase (beta-lactamase superfamily II) [Spirochaeta isovalerica]
MRLLMFYGYAGRANTYIIGPKEGGNAILIDPGRFEVPLLNMIENNNYYIESIILTHGHGSHSKGVSTTLKVYNSSIYAAVGKVDNYRTIMVSDKEKLKISGFDVEFFEIPGHSTDSLVFKIGNLLFTGDIFTSGYLGNPINAYAHNNMQREIQERLLTMDGEIIVLPGHGPPSTIQAEREINENLYIPADVTT